jgi:tRNA G18 (ribose-2'-O)-methylase SpoU
MGRQFQLEHKDHQPAPITSPLSILLDDVNDPLNVGSLFRLADAMAINNMYLCGDTSTPPDAKIHKTSRNCENYIPYQHHNDATSLIRTLQDRSITLIALEITNQSIALSIEALSTILSCGQSCCLIIGSEQKGISQPLLDSVDFSIHIPMLGNNSSMNVAMAAAIACFELNQVLLSKD